MDQPVAIQIDKNKFWRPTDVGDGPTGQPMTPASRALPESSTVDPS